MENGKNYGNRIAYWIFGKKIATRDSSSVIADTNGVHIEVIRESQFGEFDTSRTTAVYCIIRPDGSHYIKLKNGESFVTQPLTIVREYTK